MAYDLIAGNHPKAGQKVAEIAYEELPLLSALTGKANASFLLRISDVYKDASFGPQDLQMAWQSLLALDPMRLEPKERQFLYKLIAAVSYAMGRGTSLYGVAD